MPKLVLCVFTVVLLAGCSTDRHVPNGAGPGLEGRRSIVPMGESCFSESDVAEVQSNQGKDLAALSQSLVTRLPAKVVSQSDGIITSEVVTVVTQRACNNSLSLTCFSDSDWSYVSSLLGRPVEALPGSIAEKLPPEFREAGSIVDAALAANVFARTCANLDSITIGNAQDAGQLLLKYGFKCHGNFATGHGAISFFEFQVTPGDTVRLPRGENCFGGPTQIFRAGKLYVLNSSFDSYEPIESYRGPQAQFIEYFETPPAAGPVDSFQLVVMQPISIPTGASGLGARSDLTSQSSPASNFDFATVSLSTASPTFPPGYEMCGDGLGVCKIPSGCCNIRSKSEFIGSLRVTVGSETRTATVAPQIFPSNPSESFGSPIEVPRSARVKGWVEAGWSFVPRTTEKLKPKCRVIYEKGTQTLILATSCEAAIKRELALSYSEPLNIVLQVENLDCATKQLRPWNRVASIPLIPSCKRLEGSYTFSALGKSRTANNATPFPAQIAGNLPVGASSTSGNGRWSVLNELYYDTCDVFQVDASGNSIRVGNCLEKTSGEHSAVIREGGFAYELRATPMKGCERLQTNRWAISGSATRIFLPGLSCTDLTGLKRVKVELEVGAPLVFAPQNTNTVTSILTTTRASTQRICSTIPTTAELVPAAGLSTVLANPAPNFAAANEYEVSRNSSHVLQAESPLIAFSNYELNSAGATVRKWMGRAGANCSFWVGEAERQRIDQWQCVQGTCPPMPDQAYTRLTTFAVGRAGSEVIARTPSSVTIVTIPESTSLESLFGCFAAPPGASSSTVVPIPKIRMTFER